MSYNVSATWQILLMLLTASIALLLGPVASTPMDRPVSLCLTHASPSGRWLAHQLLSSSRNPIWLPQFYLLGNPLPRVKQPQVRMYSPVFLLQTLNKQPPNSPANTPFVLLQPQPAQHSTCSARGFPEAALEPELVWQHHSHLWKEFKISRPISCMSWSLGIISFGSIPADSDLRSSLWTLATPWTLAPMFCALWLPYYTAVTSPSLFLQHGVLRTFCG